jgi:hypothetical protein
MAVPSPTPTLAPTQALLPPSLPPAPSTEGLIDSCIATFGATTLGAGVQQVATEDQPFRRGQQDGPIVRV